MKISNEIFDGPYVRALATAALVFGVVHVLQVFAIALYFKPSGHIDPTAFITLAVYALIEATVFIVVGSLLAYVPSFLIASIALRRKFAGPLLASILGAALGIAFLPICASVLFFVFQGARRSDLSG